MKKAYIPILALCLIFQAQAQDKSKQTLENNMNTIENLTQMLEKDYKQISKLETVLPKSNFTMGDIVCISPFGDANANSQTEVLEQQFEAFFANSPWIFGANTYERPEFGTNGSLTVTAGGQTAQSNYSSSGAQFKPGTIFEGLEANISVFQRKDNPKSFIFTMPVQGICVLVFEMKKA